MNKEKVFEVIEIIEDEITLLEKRKTEMMVEIKEKCLQLLKNKHGITIGTEIDGHKISNVKINSCNKSISYRLEGVEKQKDNSFGKKEYFIKYIYIERNEDE